MSLWEPSSLSELFAWYKADSLSLSDGDPISTLTDSDSATYSLTSSGAARPTYSANALNNLPVMTFSGSQWLTSATTNPWAFLNQSTGGTVVSVWRAGNVSDPNAIYGMYGNNGLSALNHGACFCFDDRASVPRNETLLLLTRNSVNNYFTLTSNGYATPNTPILTTSVHDNNNATAASKLLIGINGSSLSGSNTSSNSPSVSNPAFAFQLGAAGNNASPLAGYIAEVCIFNSVLSATNRQLTEGYLAWKWGLEANLPSDHPYKTGAPTTGAQRRVINDGLFNRGLFGRSLVR